MDCLIENYSKFLSEIGIALTEEQVALLNKFRSAFYETNRHTNLTTIPEEHFNLKHFLDSVIVQKYIPTGSKVLDIGCGPGFPSWPLALVRPDLTIHAMDSSGKMLNFLKSQKLPNIECFSVRAEEHIREFASEFRFSYDVVTGRAVAPLIIQLEISAPYLKKKGIWIPFRTIHEREEIENIPCSRFGLQLNEVVEIELPDSDIIRLLPIFEKVKSTSCKYPRPWSVIRAEYKKSTSE